MKFITNWQTTGVAVSLLLLCVFKTAATGTIDTADLTAGLTALGFIAAKDAGQ